MHFQLWKPATHPNVVVYHLHHLSPLRSAMNHTITALTMSLLQSASALVVVSLQ